MPNSGTHTVKSGETLSKIAAKLGTTVKALADANGIRDANRIAVGQVLKIPGKGSAPTPAPPPAPPTPAPPPSSPSKHVLGGLSSKFETSGRGPGTVSGGVGDPGGVSYGSYQLASKLGRPAQFLAAEGSRWAAEFGGTVQGTAAFSTIWKAIAAREATAFHDAQHDYIERTHYDVQAAKVRAATGVDIDKRGDAVRDAVWSTSVQHGPTTDVVIVALKGGKPDDRTLLEAIYAERGRVRADGKLARFPSASAAVQAGVARRFRDELKDALKMLPGG